MLVAHAAKKSPMHMSRKALAAPANENDFTEEELDRLADETIRSMNEVRRKWRIRARVMINTEEDAAPPDEPAVASPPPPEAPFAGCPDSDPGEEGHLRLVSGGEGGNAMGLLVSGGARGETLAPVRVHALACP